MAFPPSVGPTALVGLADKGGISLIAGNWR